MTDADLSKKNKLKVKSRCAKFSFKNYNTISVTFDDQRIQSLTFHRVLHKIISNLAGLSDGVP